MERGEVHSRKERLYGRRSPQGETQSHVRKKAKSAGPSMEGHPLSGACRSPFSRLERPRIDLFASSQDYQFWGLWSRIPSCGISRGCWCTPFPPMALLSRVLLQVPMTPNYIVRLVAPLWQRQLWFPKQVVALRDRAGPSPSMRGPPVSVRHPSDKRLIHLA